METRHNPSNCRSNRYRHPNPKNPHLKKRSSFSHGKCRPDTAARCDNTDGEEVSDNEVTVDVVKVADDIPDDEVADDDDEEVDDEAISDGEHEVTTGDDGEDVTPAFDDEGDLTPVNEDEITPDDEDDEVTPDDEDDEDTPDNEDDEITSDDLT